MLLFLDFDGVLHPAIYKNNSDLFCRRSLLENSLRNCQHVDVVITSTWRENRTLEELRSLFSTDIRSRIIGKTPNWRDIQSPSEMGSYVRQAEVKSWLLHADKNWESWVVLDDQPHLFRPFLSNLVRTDPAIGLTNEICLILEEKLSSI
ncbi:HAD domain-containing protein [Herbaspirillum lusitanum]|uniref:HAD domain-containing protein n=1 Tax=Herbaspirillum lusitanum TaxID=213312 RepID=UPI0011A19729|nr:HAD domain-containing protein [Herbaspirillum lusitanum]